MKAVILRVGKGRTDWADAAFHDYGRRLRSTLAVTEELVKPAKFTGDVEAVRAAEAEALLARVRDGDQLIALDERGELPTTEQFTDWIDQSAKRGTRRLVFAIGGPYGHGAQVRAQSWKTLALGRMVINHELARVVLVEQLYRASTLLWGGSYHH